MELEIERDKGGIGMIPVKMDAITVTTMKEKGIHSVVDWFERHKQPFYALGWFYLRNQQQMEELFYQSIIKVHKELPRSKNASSLELWVTTIFIDTCRELSRNNLIPAAKEFAPYQDLFNALDQLEDDEKEAMVLTYGTGFSRESAEQVLRVSAGKLKELLFSGIVSVRRQLDGSAYNGCTEHHKNYIDYLEKTMDRPEKIEFEMHLYECRECQEDLASFQDVTLMLNHAEWMNDLPVPEHFIDNIKERLAGQEKQSQKKSRKRKRLALISLSIFVFVFGIDFFTGGIPHVYYAWAEDDEQLRTYLQNDLGQRMDLIAESEGIKITIKGVVADDFQTLVFYKIEDTNEDNQYLMHYEEGLYVENENEIMNMRSYPRYYPPNLEAEMNKEGKNVFYGKVGLRPIDKDNETLTLKISKLMRIDPNSADSMRYGFMTGDYKTGDWNFEVPVTKQPSTEYALDKETEIEGVPFRIEKLTIAPTATILHYGIHTGKPEKRIDFVRFGDLEVNNKKVKTDQFGGFYQESQYDIDWYASQTHFDSIYGGVPKEVKVQLASAQMTIEDDKSIELDVNAKYPQTFEYAGSTISIDKIEAGQPTSIFISNHDVKNREYESLHLDVVSEDEEIPYSTGMDANGVLVDKNGNVYDPMSESIDYEEIEEPRHFITEQTIRIDGDKIIPKKLIIYGYNTTKFLDDVVEITVK
jgi:DNA-directed RNA polymerase specialized sigma24 family protein